MGHFIQRVLDLFDESPLSQSLPPAQFAHPRASRHIALATCDVAYAFRRAKRRTIGMVIGPDGLEVRAPRWVTLGEVESTLHEKADWIVRKLVEMQEQQRRLGEARIQWCDGVVLRYLGASLQVVLDSSAALKKIARSLKLRATKTPRLKRFTCYELAFPPAQAQSNSVTPPKLG